jgi:hypothetical protein
MSAVLTTPTSVVTPAAANGDVEMAAPANETTTEEPEDPNRIPDEALETLYLQNLNESVRIESQSFLLWR